MIMKTSTTVLVVLLTTVLLGGCATRTPAATGNTVRAIMASQIISPEAKESTPGSAAGTAILAYKNYQGSFAAPAPQVEISLFGRK
jgi:type IV pilus biogenesis protein CpaD/CtpE